MRRGGGTAASASTAGGGPSPPAGNCRSVERVVRMVQRGGRREQPRRSRHRRRRRGSHARVGARLRRSHGIDPGRRLPLELEGVHLPVQGGGLLGQEGVLHLELVPGRVQPVRPPRGDGGGAGRCSGGSRGTRRRWHSGQVHRRQGHRQATADGRGGSAAGHGGGWADDAPGASSCGPRRGRRGLLGHPRSAGHGAPRSVGFWWTFVVVVGGGEGERERERERERCSKAQYVRVR